MHIARGGLPSLVTPGNMMPDLFQVYYLLEHILYNKPLRK